MGEALTPAIVELLHKIPVAEAYAANGLAEPLARTSRERSLGPLPAPLLQLVKLQWWKKRVFESLRTEAAIDQKQHDYLLTKVKAEVELIGSLLWFEVRSHFHAFGKSIRLAKGWEVVEIPASDAPEGGMDPHKAFAALGLNVEVTERPEQPPASA